MGHQIQDHNDIERRDKPRLLPKGRLINLILHKMLGEIQTAVGDLGRAAINGEFESMDAIRKVAPGFVATPIASGSMKDQPKCHFYLGRYLPIVDELVEPASFCEQIARLHKNSVSPNNQYGFHTVTFNGDLPQKNDYSSSWESFFAAGFHHMLAINTERAGPSEELEVLLPAFFEKVIPRLLRPLEGNIKPSLVRRSINLHLCFLTSYPRYSVLTITLTHRRGHVVWKCRP